MNIYVKRTLASNIYSVEFSTDFTSQESDLIEKFGDPEINCGGSITGPPAFDLSDQYRKLKAGFPFSYQVDGNGDDEASDKVLAWITEIRGRCVTAITTLRDQTDTFTGETIETV